VNREHSHSPDTGVINQKGVEGFLLTVLLVSCRTSGLNKSAAAKHAEHLSRDMFRTSQQSCWL
jgi:hypothetical protein